MSIRVRPCQDRLVVDPAQRSQQVAAVFDRSAATYDAVGVAWFTPIAEHLVQLVAPQPGERALDIGCGRGAALWPLAKAVGAQGFVTGIDLAPNMIQATAADARNRGLDQVDLHVMDAAAPELPAAAFDVVTASLVLFFLPDPAGALTRWNDLLAPGGRLGVTTFSGQDATFVQLDELFTPYLAPQMLDARASGRRGPFASDAGVEQLLTGAGLGDVRTDAFTVIAKFDDAEHWLTWSWSHGQRAMWEAVPSDQHEQIRAAATDLLPPGPIHLTQQVRCTTGRRPS